MKILKTLVPTLFLFAVFAINVQAQDNKKKKDVYFTVEKMPVYPGGQKAIREDIAKAVKYPEVAKKNGIQGKVFVTFIVNEQGKIADAKIARGVDPSLDKEALRVMNTLDKTWTPGKEKGKAVKVSYTVPINFSLGDGESSGKKKVASKKDGDVYFIVEEMPVYPGGDIALRKFISENVKYPDIAKKNGIQGKVYVTFVVDIDGSITGAKIARGVDPSLNKESLRVVNALPKWIPGKENGKPVKVQYTVPISFALS